MGAFLHLLPGHGHTGVPVFVEHGQAEGLGAIGIGSFAYHQERLVLLERHMGIQRCGARLEYRMTRWHIQIGAPLHDGGEMLRAGTAASADDTDAELGDELMLMLGQLRRREVVVHVTVHHAGHAGIGQTRQRDM